MKFSFVSAIAALAMVAALAGCGGKEQFTVQGTIVGLANSGLVLANAGEQITIPSGATSFAFSRQIDYGTDYSVTIVKDPDHMACSVSGGTGSAGHNIAIQVGVSCLQNTYSLGGQFTGLTAAADGTARTVTLTNGSTGGSVLISSASATNGAGDFVFSAQVPDGTAYGVTVVDPANGLKCTVTNGTGVMHETQVSNILVNCVPQ